LGSITRHCINHDFVNLSPTQGSVTHQRVNCDWQTHVHVRGAGEKSRRRLYGRWRVERGRPLHAASSGGSDLIVQLLMPDANASR
jgi:hypothetical protein